MVSGVSKDLEEQLKKLVDLDAEIMALTKDMLTGAGTTHFPMDYLATAVMIELDPEIAAVWQTIFSDDNQWLAGRILNFTLTMENAREAIDMIDKQIRDVAFSTVLKNRIYHGGIIAKGSGPLKKGKCIASRWYAQTLYDRITAIQQVRDRATFRTGDAFQVLEEYRDRADCYFFIDPPYTVAGKRL